MQDKLIVEIEKKNLKQDGAQTSSSWHAIPFLLQTNSLSNLKDLTKTYQTHLIIHGKEKELNV